MNNKERTWKCKGKTSDCIYNRDNNTIEIHTKEAGFVYKINLEECNNGLEILDWIYQVFDKTWGTPQTVYDLIECFEIVCQEKYQQSMQQYIEEDQKWM